MGLAAAVLGGVIAGAVLRSPPVDVLLGQLDVHDARSATAPPPPGLGVAWRTPGPEAFPTSSGHAAFAVGRPVVDGRRVLVGGVVIDLDTGSVVADTRGAPLYGHLHGQHRLTVLRDQRLTVVDLLDGEVVELGARTGDVAADGRRVEPVAVTRGPGTALFVTFATDSEEPRPGWVLVADDGTVVADGPGTVLTPGRFAAGDPRFVTVAQQRGTGSAQVFTVLDLTSGAMVWEGRGVPVVHGDHLMTTVDTPRLVDLTTGTTASLGEWDEGDGRVTLLGVTDAGDAVVGLAREGGGVAVLSDATGRTTELLEVPLHGNVWFGRSPLDGRIVVDAGRVVATVGSTGRVVAHGLRGGQQWEVDLGATVSQVAAADGLVVAVVERPGARRLHLLDGVDGSRLARVDLPHDDRPRVQPVAALDGVVALAPVEDAVSPPRLGDLTWVESATGEVREPGELLERWWPLEGAANRPTVDELAAWSFLGLQEVEDEVGPLPLLGTLDRTDRQLRVLGPGGRVDDHALPPREPPGDPTLVGVVGGHLVVQESDRTGLLLVERATGELQRAPRRWAEQLVAGQVLASDVGSADAGAETVVALIDPTTGAPRWTVARPLRDSRSASGDEELLAMPSGPSGVQAIDAQNDGVRWQVDVGALVRRGALLGPSTVVVHTTHGGLLALEREDGSTRWRLDLGVPVTAATLAGDAVLVGTHDGQVVHVDGRGHEVQRVEVGTGPVDGVAALGETVVAVVDGAVVGLRPGATGITDRDEVPLPAVPPSSND